MSTPAETSASTMDRQHDQVAWLQTQRCEGGGAVPNLLLCTLPDSGDLALESRGVVRPLPLLSLQHAGQLGHVPLHLILRPLQRAHDNRVPVNLVLYPCELVPDRSVCLQCSLCAIMEH